MKTGFYKLSKLNKKQLKSFFKDAIMLSYDCHIEKIDSFYRERATEKSIAEMINNVSKENHNVCIDRSVQYKDTLVGEIGYCTLAKNPDYFLYIFMTLENLKTLTEKYNLEMA